VGKGGTLQRAIEKHVSNPIVRAALQLGIAPRAFALLETTGHRSGVIRRTPVGNGLEGPVFWLVSMHGRQASYVKNLIADPRVRVKVRRAWYSGSAFVLAGDDAVARRRRLDLANGLIGRFDGMVFTMSAREPLTIRIDLSQ
jgi:deazaflavin-dependent oxidoreductase (nitroreductase family)